MDINDRVRALLKGQPGVRHAKQTCVLTNYWYHGRTTRKDGQRQEQYTCPECKRKGRFQRNYLSQRRVMCDGIKFTKEQE